VASNWILIFLLVMWALLLPFAAFASELKIANVRPDKICYKPGEEATFTVVVENAGSERVDLALRCEVVGDVNNATPIGSQSFQMAPGASKELSFSWDTTGAEWGYDIVAKLLDDKGAVLDNASETFAVTCWNWKVGGGGTYWVMHFGREKPFEKSIFEPEGAAEAADSLCREYYGTHVEFYSWEPSGFNERTPDFEKWQSGQGAYNMSKEGIRTLVGALQKRGIWALTHQHTVLSGPIGLEFARQHPEYLRYSESGGAGFGNQEMIDLQAKGEAKHGTHYFAGVAWGGPFDEEMLKIHAGEIIGSIGMFGWDGLRSDGMPLISLKDKPLVYEWPSSGWRYDGMRLGVDTPEEADKRTAQAWRYIKEAVRKQYPDFVFAMNTPRGPVKHLRRKKVYLETWKEWMRDAMRVSEEYMGATRPKHHFNRWDNIRSSLREKQDLVRELGGIQVFGPCYPGHCPASITLSAVIGAMQSHPWCVSGMPRNHQRFRMRYSGLITAPEVERIPSAEADEIIKVTGERGIWWKETAYRIPEPTDKERVVVHLINEPTRPMLDIEDKTPPPVQKDVTVMVQIPAGKEISAAWLLNPDSSEPTQCREVKPDVELTGPIDEAGYMHPDTGCAKVVIPELQYWRVAVFEFAP